MKKKYLLLLMVTLLLPINVLATSGKLQGDSITSCNGQSYGKHGKDNHWHVAIKQGDYWYPNGEQVLSNNPCVNTNDYNSNNNSATNNDYNTNKIVNTNTIIEKQKSSDTSLKEIKINDDNITISKYMEYETKSEKVTISAIANDNKATLEYAKEQNLIVGSNKYKIKVIAENGAIDYYDINIKRRELSSNKGFKIYYKDKELTKNIFEKTIESIDVGNNVENINFKYKLDDENTKINFIGNDNLKVGENKVKIIVTAEDKSTETYTIIVDRTSKIVDIIATIITICIMIIAPITIIIYFILKRTKNRKEISS